MKKGRRNRKNSTGTMSEQRVNEPSAYENQRAMNESAIGGMDESDLNSSQLHFRP